MSGAGRSTSHNDRNVLLGESVSSGIDVGSVRCDLAMMDGLEAADPIVKGYLAAGAASIDVA